MTQAVDRVLQAALALSEDEQHLLLLSLEAAAEERRHQARARGCPMTADDVRVLLRAQPFRPFRLICHDGRRFDITHPNYVRLWGGYIHIYFGDDPLGPMDDVKYLGLELF